MEIELLLDKAIKENLKVSWRYADYSEDTWTVGQVITERHKNTLLTDLSVVQVRIAFNIK
jgi:hypothetical protein